MAIMLGSKNISIDVISILYKLTTFLAITPSFDFETGQADGFGLLFSLLMVSAIVGMFGYSMYGRFTGSYDDQKYATYIFLSLASYCMLSFGNLSACYNVRFKYGKKVVELLRGFMDIDKRLQRKQSNAVTMRFYAELVLYYGLLILYAVYDEVYQAVSFGKSFDLAIFVRKPQTFLGMSLALLINNFATHFKYRFEIINEALDKHRESFLQPVHVVQAKKIDDTKYTFHQLNSCFVKLSELVNLFNEIFGWQIMYLSANFVLGLLYSINSAITEMNDTVVTNISIHFWINTGFYSIVVVTLCIPLASACNAAADEAKNTSLICYALLATLKLSDKETSKEELSNLASIDSPTFSAAGFFEVDHTMLFMLFGSVTSYLIVLIQLKDMML